MTEPSIGLELALSTVPLSGRAGRSQETAWVYTVYSTKGVYREEGMQLTMYRTYSSNFVLETGYAKNRIQYTDVNKWAVLFTEL